MCVGRGALLNWIVQHYRVAVEGDVTEKEKGNEDGISQLRP